MGVQLLHWVAAILLLLGVGLWLALEQGWLTPKPVEPIRVDFDPSCDLRAGPCETVLKNGARVRFGILPLDIPVAKTLDVEVDVSGMDVEAVTLDLNGVNMKMPPNRVKLKPVAAGEFKGQAGLMLCTRSAMEWETVVELKTSSGQIINVPYRFITVSDGNYDGLTN
jgi:hypothetical protein